MSKLVQPLKIFGGKHYLADWIISKMPPHLHFVEPYAGGLSVLLAKDPKGVSEVINDLDWRVTNFWKVLQNEIFFEKFCRKIQAVPFSQYEWETASSVLQGAADWKFTTPDVDAAVSFFILSRQSLAGRNDGFCPLSRTRTRRGMNEQASSWWNSVDGLRPVYERMRRVVVLHDDALNVIKKQDGRNTLFYMDPTYLHDTRASKKVYACEMTYEQHTDLLLLLATIEGKFLLSGYHSELYDRHAQRNAWRIHEKEIDNKSAGGDKKRKMIEVLWTNV